MHNSIYKQFNKQLAQRKMEIEKKQRKELFSQVILVIESDVVVAKNFQEIKFDTLIYNQIQEIIESVISIIVKNVECAVKANIELAEF